jgi:Fe-S oxidoreductase
MNVWVKNIQPEAKSVPGTGRSPARAIDFISRNCILCGQCLEECAFLRHHGMPGLIADQWLAGDDRHLATAFACSLCRLCTRICPQGLPMAEMFLDLRRAAVARGQGRFSGYLALHGYEAIGSSPFLTGYLLPAGCTTVFFPGCSLPGIRSKQTFQLFLLLRERIPGLGIVLDCCNKPSHDCGFHQRFLANFSRKVDRLRAGGVGKVIAACPSCYQVFRQYGQGLETTIIYSHLTPHGAAKRKSSDRRYTIHDPCTLRFDPHIHQAVRQLVRSLGIELTEMEHNRTTTICCGEGGGVCHLPGGRHAGWRKQRLVEAGDAGLLTYCAGCTVALASRQTSHLLDVLLPAGDRPGKVAKIVRAPWTYLHRLFLKLKLVAYFRNAS